MALYHCSIKIISRGKGKSAVAAAAYRSGAKITNERDGEIHDYTRKGGVIHTEILLPDNAPTEYADRATLWNAAQKIEKAKTSQLARDIEIFLPVELTREQNLSLAREYVKRHFVAEGMCADICIHDTSGGNPHAHIMLTMRHFEQGGKWGKKQKKEYILDENDNKIYDPIKRQYKCNSIPLTDWNEHSKAEQWRSVWADCVNAALEQNGHTERVDHRSYERLRKYFPCGKYDQIATIHLGAAASQMKKRGIATERGNLNREIEISNQRLRQLKAQVGKSSVSQSIYNLKDASNMLMFLQQNQIMDMAGLDKKFSSMLDEQMDIRDKLKPIERRLPVLKKHMEQADIYFKNKGKKRLSEADQILFTAATNYLKGAMNGHSSLPVKAWKTEYAKLTAEHRTLNGRYLSLKGKVKEAEQIRKSIYSILRQEQRGQ